MDPTLMEAHREVSEYLGEAAPDVEAAVPGIGDAEPEPLPADPAEDRPGQPTIPTVDDAEPNRPEPGDPATPTDVDG